MLFTRLVTLFILFIKLSFSAAKADELPQFHIYTEIWPPYQFIENDELTGLSVELFEMMLNNVGSAQTRKSFQVVPWARGMNYLKTLDNTVLFLTTRTPEREGQFKWVGPVFDNVAYVITRKVPKIDLEGLVNKKTITAAAVRDDASASYLTLLGVPQSNIFFTNTADSALKMLAAGRVNIIVDNWENFSSLVAEIGLNTEDFVTASIAHKDNVSYAFNKQTPDWVIKKFQDALTSIINEGKLKALEQKYQVTLTSPEI